MKDLIRVGDQFYVLATSALADDRTLVLKDGETFAVFDRYGDISPLGRGEQGLYHESTRFLSRLELRLGASRPLLLESTVHSDNSQLTADMTNPDININEGFILKRGMIHLFRQKFLLKGTCFERFRLLNHGMDEVELPFILYFGADFSDLFEVRGMRREGRGEIFPPEVDNGSVRLAYSGVDGVTRTLRVEPSFRPEGLTGSQLSLQVRLAPQEQTEMTVAYRCETGGRIFPRTTFGHAFREVEEQAAAMKSSFCGVETSNGQFNDLLRRSVADIRMLITDTPHGPYPYAGVPWFSTVFGRDGIITALECLWINPHIARGVLGYLADTQSWTDDPDRDAEPGKILHETRIGEMAASGEIPFGRYYGSVDSTPLFVMLAGACCQRTGDRDFISGIWPNIERALEWMDSCGDRDGDGFVEYLQRSKQGLSNQGWKDSTDSVMHSDGKKAEGPIALCEVQGYVYAAKRAAAEIASLLGFASRAELLRRQAKALKRRFAKSFWVPGLNTYAIALDGKKNQCRVKSSNAGHCLYSKIAEPEHAKKIVEGMLSDDMFTGWGIRTLSSSETRYNPMSYHNGSIWPHDNAIAGAGFAYYGFREQAAAALSSLFEVSRFTELSRLPELFCGFHKRPGQGPVRYPVACSPQAWAAGAVFLLLQACLGMTIDAQRERIRFENPFLPQWIENMRVSGLKVGSGALDLMFVRRGMDVSVDVISRKSPVEVVVVK